ncbi:hypothetical protein ATP06_0234000 [Amycolatopsis regifaucium]|uniref:Uncharacterized protein n=1 Tax=Amycolatopsis regifaucium TaxID=546365 RepID=A0ABX3DI95_9PSEU|nr:hypothetical protein ATP06_0234000 [Amycolatopsis regifaucium]
MLEAPKMPALRRTPAAWRASLSTQRWRRRSLGLAIEDGDTGKDLHFSNGAQFWYFAAASRVVGALTHAGVTELSITPASQPVDSLGAAPAHAAHSAHQGGGAWLASHRQFCLWPQADGWATSSMLTPSSWGTRSASRKSRGGSIEALATDTSRQAAWSGREWKRPRSCSVDSVLARRVARR